MLTTRQITEFAKRRAIARAAGLTLPTIIDIGADYSALLSDLTIIRP